MNQIAVVAIDTPHACSAQLDGTLDDDVEHWLDVRGRTGDDLQYLGRRRLLLAGFLELLARTRTTLNSGGRWRIAAFGLGGLAALCWGCVAAFRLTRLAARY